jgi:hypothetical protein
MSNFNPTSRAFSFDELGELGTLALLPGEVPTFPTRPTETGTEPWDVFIATAAATAAATAEFTQDSDLFDFNTLSPSFVIPSDLGTSARHLLPQIRK